MQKVRNLIATVVDVEQKLKEGKKKHQRKRFVKGKKKMRPEEECVKRLKKEVESERMKRHRRVGGGNHSQRRSFFWQWELVNKRVEIEGSELGEMERRRQEEWKRGRRRSWVRTDDMDYKATGQRSQHG